MLLRFGTCLLVPGYFFFIVCHKIMFYILYIFMGGRRAVEGRDGRRLARRREAGGKSL